MKTTGRAKSITERHLQIGGIPGIAQTTYSGSDVKITKNEIRNIIKKSSALLDRFIKFPNPSRHGITRFYGADEYPLLTTQAATVYLPIGWRLNEQVGDPF